MPRTSMWVVNCLQMGRAAIATFMHWMELARIPRIRRKLYVGHATVHDVSDLYEEHEVQGFLAEDRERLQRFLGEEPGRLLRAI